MTLREEKELTASRDNDTAGKKGIGRKHKSLEKKGKLQVENIETGTEERTSQGNTKHDRHYTGLK